MPSTPEFLRWSYVGRKEEGWSLEKRRTLIAVLLEISRVIKAHRESGAFGHPHLHPFRRPGRPLLATTMDRRDTTIPKQTPRVRRVVRGIPLPSIPNVANGRLELDSVWQQSQ